MVIVKALKPVFINGRIVEKGFTFSCSSDFAKKLIEGKTAELAEAKKTAPKRNSSKKAAESDEL